MNWKDTCLKCKRLINFWTFQQVFYCWFISRLLVMAYKSLQKTIILQSKQPCKKPVSSELLFAAYPRQEPRKRDNLEGAWSLLWIKFAFVTPIASFLHQVKGVSSLQVKLTPWQNNRVVSLQQSEICLAIFTEPRLFNKVRAASPLRCSRLSNKLELRFYFRRAPYLQGNTTFASTWPASSLCFCNQFNSM